MTQSSVHVRNALSIYWVSARDPIAAHYSWNFVHWQRSSLLFGFHLGLANSYNPTARSNDAPLSFECSLEGVGTFFAMMLYNDFLLGHSNITFRSKICLESMTCITYTKKRDTGGLFKILEKWWTSIWIIPYCIRKNKLRKLCITIDWVHKNGCFFRDSIFV